MSLILPLRQDQLQIPIILFPLSCNVRRPVKKAQDKNEADGVTPPQLTN
jgi:hypothetical protein